MVRFEPVPGQVALIESPGGAHQPVTGIVVRARPLTIDAAGASGVGSSDGAVVEVVLCGGGARWRVGGTAAVGPDGLLTVDPVTRVELVERRAGPRRLAWIGLTILPLENERADPAPWPAHTVDIGAGGIRLETSHRLAPGERATVIVPLPGGSPVMCAGRVVATDAVRDGWCHRLAFSELRSVDADRLAAFVASPETPGSGGSRHPVSGGSG